MMDFIPNMILRFISVLISNLVNSFLKILHKMTWRLLNWIAWISWWYVWFLSRFLLGIGLSWLFYWRQRIRGGIKWIWCDDFSGALSLSVLVRSKSRRCTVSLFNSNLQKYWAKTQEMLRRLIFLSTLLGVVFDTPG